METAPQDARELAPVESEATEIMRLINDGDPDIQLQILEKKAELAPRFANAIQKILITQTYPDDWECFDGKHCLSSAGAERVGRMFPISTFDVKWKKETFEDASGKGYRYVYEGYGTMGDRKTYAQGVYSTRNKFHGFKQGEWRPLEDINENDIRTAAYHIFIGNVVKSLLGIRAIPETEFTKIMQAAGHDPAKATAVNHGKGTQGGTTQEDAVMQKEFAEILLDLANSGYIIEINESGEHTVEMVSEIADPVDTAKLSCKALTSFYSKKDKKIIDGIDSAKMVKGKRLEIALKNAKNIQAKIGGGGSQ